MSRNYQLDLDELIRTLEIILSPLNTHIVGELTFLKYYQQLQIVMVDNSDNILQNLKELQKLKE